MRYFFDSSVLVPVFISGHEHHQRSLDVFSAAGRSSGYCGAHSLAEVYSSLTRLPGKYRAAPEQALLFLETILERLNVITLSPVDYVAAIREAAEIGIEGGAVYDALLGACAVKANVDVLYTWNARDFSRLSPNVSKRVRIP